MKRLLTYILSVLFTTLGVSAQTTGEEGFEFLNLPYSSHASALGGENISLIEDDASLAFHNPALLQSVCPETVSFGYMNYMKGVNAFSANYVGLVNDKGTFGILAQYVNYGTMKEVDVNNNIMSDFSASDLAIGGQLSYVLAKNIVGGVTAKFIYSHLGDYSSTAVAVDLGINYYNENKDFSASIVARNLGGQISAYYEDFESLPFDLQIGMTKRLIGTPIRVSLTATDMEHWNYSFFKHLTLGADLLLGKQFYVAAGYNFRRASDMKIASTDSWGDDDSSNHGAGLTFGAGLQMERFKLHVSYGTYHVSSSGLLINAAFTL